MEAPIESNGYMKYIIQIGWWKPAPGVLMAVLAQDVLTKTRKDGNYLMKVLYPESLGVGLPYLCPIIEEIETRDEEDEENFIDQLLNDNKPKTIDLVYPN